MLHQRLISIVVPIYNEALVLEELHQRLTKVTSEHFSNLEIEFIFVDDGSADDSLNVLNRLGKNDKRIAILELRANYGQTAALQAGLSHARGDVVISMDGDLQHFPEDIPKLIQSMEKNNFDVVCGWREFREEGIIRRWPSLVANYFLRTISGLNIHDMGTTFRAYRREILDDIVLMGEGHRFVPIFAKVAGARVGETSIQNIERPVGKSNYGIGRALNVFLDLFFLYFFVKCLDRPIRIFGKISLICFTFAIAITISLAYIWIATGRPVVRDHSGFFTIAVMLYLSSAVFIMVGILAELMARIYFSSGKKQPYKIRQISSPGSKRIQL